MSVNKKAFFGRVLPVGALLFLVMFKFQNCAPADPTSQLNSSDDSVVTIVDRWNPQKIAFVQSDFVVPNETQKVDLLGLCVGSAKGQIIEYQIWADSSGTQIIEHGEVECMGGGFELPVLQVSFSSCNEKWRVRAAKLGDNSAYAEAEIKPECSGT